jgi:hypothetical protein
MELMTGRAEKVKTVTDRGGGVGEKQLDNYNPDIKGCPPAAKIPHLGDFVTLKLIK